METLIETYPREHHERQIESTDTTKQVQRALRLYELSEARNEARRRIEQDQERQRQRHDQNVRLVVFAVNDLVLLHDTAKAKQHTGKFEPKWMGPYRVHAVLGRGVYRLADLDGNVVNKPFNAKRLKLYRRRAMWEPQVIVEQAPIEGRVTDETI